MARQVPNRTSLIPRRTYLRRGRPIGRDPMRPLAPRPGFRAATQRSRRREALCRCCPPSPRPEQLCALVSAFLRRGRSRVRPPGFARRSGTQIERRPSSRCGAHLRGRFSRTRRVPAACRQRTTRNKRESGLPASPGASVSLRSSAKTLAFRRRGPRPVDRRFSPYPSVETVGDGWGTSWPNGTPCDRRAAAMRARKTAVYSGGLAH